MLRRKLVLCFRSLAGLLAAGFLLIHPGVSPVNAAQLSTQQVNQFLANPSAILKANPTGGGRLVSAIRDLMLSDVCFPSPVSPHLPACDQVLKSIIALLADANDEQKTAIGTGLGVAAQTVVTTNPTLANDIQTALANSGVKLALESYQTTVGNQAIGAAGGGGGGGGGNDAAYQTLTNSGGGGGGGNQNGPNGTGTQGFGLSSSGNVGNSSNTTVVQQVSPR